MDDAGRHSRFQRHLPTVRLALEHPDAAYGNKDYTVFLQGSYGNDTNVYAESDVDVVILLNSTFYRDQSDLPQDEADALEQSISGASYSYNDFRRDVLKRLPDRFGDAVSEGEKAIRIAAGAGRRSSDVVVAAQFRRYLRFRGEYDQDYVRGICLFTKTDHTRVANYPRQHSENCTSKHQATSSRFKPTVRMFKNLRRRLVEEGKLEARTAPSYYIEGLLSNAPNELFVANLTDRFIGVVQWMIDAPKSEEWVCANDQYYLLRADSHVTWTANNFIRFRDAVVAKWNE